MSESKKKPTHSPSKLVCETCGSNFKYKSGLSRHRATAKYCLLLKSSTSARTLVCNGCNATFERTDSLKRHKTKCGALGVIDDLTKQLSDANTKVEFLADKVQVTARKLGIQQHTIDTQAQTITDLKAQVASLQDKLASIAEKAVTKPTTQINNTRINKQVNQLLPLTQEHIQSQVPNLTIEHIKRGAQGYADFALEYAFKDRLACTDFSRRRVKYKNEEGEVIDDPDMKKVSKQFFQAIHDHNTTLTNQYGQELYNKLTDILQNAGDELTQEETDKLQLTQQRILQEISKVNTSRIDVTDIAKGKKSELLPEFVREVCATSS